MLNKSAIAIFICLSLCVAAKVAFFPEYAAEAVVKVGSKQSPTSARLRTEDVQGEVALIRKHSFLMLQEPVLRIVAEELKLDEDQTRNSFSALLRPFHRDSDKDLSAKDRKESRMRDVIAALQKKIIKLESPPFTDFIVIKVRYGIREKTADIANRLVPAYTRWNVMLSHLEIGSLLEYLNQEIQSAREALEASERELVRYEENYGITQWEEQMTSNIEQRSRFKKQLVDLEINLNRQRELYSDNSPQVLAGIERVEIVKGAIQTLNSGSLYPVLDSSGGQADAGTNSDSLSMPERTRRLAQLKREIALGEQVYTYLIRQREKARQVLAKDTTENIVPISRALPPLKPRGRAKTLVLGLAASAAAALIYLQILRLIAPNDKP